MTVTGVRDISGPPLAYSHGGDIVSVNLAAPLARGTRATLLIDYEGTPQPAGFLGLQFLERAGSTILATLSEPYYSRSWWPCKDVAEDKATATIMVVVPETYYCASNGVLLGTHPDGRGNLLYRWREDYPISAYNISVAATDYVGWSETWVSPSGKSMEVEYKVFPEHEAMARVDFAVTLEQLDLYSELFGEYPFVDEKYGMAEFIFEGAMEHQTMTSYGDWLITGDGFFDRLVGHELAHQWFGNLITAEDWDEVWLHEGFATYAEALWFEHIGGASEYQRYMRQHSAAGYGFWGPVVPPDPLFGGTVYDKGAWVLHMLRGIMGENDFFQTLRTWCMDPQRRYATATIADFIATAESVGQVELDWFFDQWLYRVGRPDYQVSWTSEPAGESWRVNVTIRQVQDGPSYRMPLDLVVDTGVGSQTFTVWNDGYLQTTSFMVDTEPQALRLDPQDWVLRWNQTDEVATSAAPPRRGDPQLLPNVPNPFNPNTALRFRLPRRATVRLEVLDARGRVVDRIEPGLLEAGEHSLQWRGTDRRGASLASGTYTVLLDADGRRSSRRITLLK